MHRQARTVYLISDLHLGGVQPTVPDSEDRGFRICTHGADLARFISALAERPDPIELVINGDSVDFLAEEDEGGGWSAFTADGQAAARKLDRIIDNDRDVFDALGTLVDRGHRLTLLLGNHDVELALPAVRQRLADRLGLTGRHDFHFVYDGEAYAIGRALIEHGNRYDPFNVVDHDALRRIRSLQSRRQPVAAELAFEPPAGSHMVADVVNPIKAEYRLIDLLKPETSAMVPVLMALEPGYRAVLTRVAAIGLKARRHRLAAPALPSFAGDINAPEHWDPLEVILRETLRERAGLLLEVAPLVDAGLVGDVAFHPTIDRTLGLARMLGSSRRSTMESRLPALLAAVRCLQNDESFARDAECLTEYQAAAGELASRGFDIVTFGHTHLSRDVALPAGARYLNSGTWADVIRFPSQILSGSDGQALDGLRAFVNDMSTGRLRAWTSFVPTYIELAIGEDGAVRHAALHDYSPTSAL